MKPIDVELIQAKNCLACKTNRVPEESWDDERGGYRIVSRGGWVKCFIGKNILRLCTTEKDHDCIFYPTEAEAKAAYNAYTAMIDKYNREHETPEKKDVFAPEFGECWIKDGFVWEACESTERTKHTCSICDYDKHCGEMVCKAYMYVKKIGPAITPGVFTDCTPGSGSLTGPERKTRIAEIYNDTTWNVPVVDGNERKGITVWAAAFVDKDFAGYEVQLHDGTKHIVATPVVYAGKERGVHGLGVSTICGDVFCVPSTLTGVAFFEDSSG